MRYTNYPRQRYGYGEPQMTRNESEQMSGTDKKIVAVWSVLVAALIVTVLAGLRMRGVL
jgi:hypothetical protein